MLLFEIETEIPSPSTSGDGLFELLASRATSAVPAEFRPMRFAVVDSTDGRWRCEIGGASVTGGNSPDGESELFRFIPRPIERAREFNTVLLVPTGVGASLGGHAGDACPAVRVLAAACDRLITHPNAVNASDINEMPTNGLFVEGSIITRLLMGTAGLQEVRANRLLVIVDKHPDDQFTDASINSVNAARACAGIDCGEIVVLNEPLVSRARYTNTGCAAGRVEDCQPLLDLLRARRGQYDAVAITSVVDVPPGFHREYFEHDRDMINPWGGIEALLTHAVSSYENVPSAHSPMMENSDVAYMRVPRIDPRKAAEAVSMTFLHCILKGLHKSPRVITDSIALREPGILNSSDVSCVVIPDGCLGLPTIAACLQGIPTIAVVENTNLMRNDLSQLPWQPGKFFRVANYWEAAGVMLALKAGVDPLSIRRPLAPISVTESQESTGQSNLGERQSSRL
ncbi:MAG: high light inducible protein [Planctomycetaceae bacterium]|nr:high light inducible protein [Planctomycetaceae bacterium]